MTTTTTKTKIPTRRARNATEPIALRAPSLLLDFAASNGPAPASVSWIQIARPGSFRGHPSGPFEMTAETFAQMIANHRDVDGGRVPIDFEHASEAPASEGEIPRLGAPAQGWITKLEIRDGDLWACVEWGATARDYIRKGQYRYVSPAIRFGSKHPTTGKPIGARLSSVALTNAPFLGRGDRPGSAGLAPITARDAPTRVDAPSTPIAEPSAEVVKLRAEVAALTHRCTDLETRRKEERRLLRDARAEIARRDDEEISSRVDQAIATWSLSANRRDALLVMCRSAPDAFASMYPLPTPGAPRPVGRLIATGEDREAGPVETSGRVISMRDTPDPGTSIATTAAKLRAADRDLSYDESFLRAHDIVTAEVAHRRSVIG